jgi:hypothetical protein
MIISVDHPMGSPSLDSLTTVSRVAWQSRCTLTQTELCVCIYAFSCVACSHELHETLTGVVVTMTPKERDNFVNKCVPETGLVRTRAPGYTRRLYKREGDPRVVYGIDHPSVCESTPSVCESTP